MVTEDYVSFETAKLLKEKGFDYYPDGSYWLIDANNVMYWVSEIGAYDYVDVPTESFQRPKNGYRLVTQAMAMKWLREVHNLVIEPYRTACGYLYTISNTPYGSTKYDNCEAYNGDDESSGQWTTWEKACEDGIKYCLENLI